MLFNFKSSQTTIRVSQFSISSTLALIVSVHLNKNNFLKKKNTKNN